MVALRERIPALHRPSPSSRHASLVEHFLYQSSRSGARPRFGRFLRNLMPGTANRLAAPAIQAQRRGAKADNQPIEDLLIPLTIKIWLSMMRPTRAPYFSPVDAPQKCLPDVVAPACPVHPMCHAALPGRRCRITRADCSPWPFRSCPCRPSCNWRCAWREQSRSPAQSRRKARPRDACGSASPCHRRCR